MKIRPSTDKDHKQMSQILTEAFLKYPVFIAFLPEKNHRQEFLKELFTANVKVFEKINGSYIAEHNNEIVGVMLVKDDKHPEPGILKYLVNAFWGMFRPRNLVSLRDFFQTINEMDGDLIEADEPSWYVDSLAVAVNQQGLGVGTALLRQLDKIVQHGKVVLSTNTENNSRFYEKNGYQQINFSNKNPQFKTWQFEKKIE